MTGGGVLYMIVESFRDGDPVPIYQRFRDHDRIAPEGLRYLSSCVQTDFERCYQLMDAMIPIR